jgi:beta-phosphoglucomutase family hydrolase
MTSALLRRSPPTGALRLPTGIRACLFDLDGVLTDTARIHAAAWKQTFDAFLLDRARSNGTPFVPFDEARDYLEWVDGRQRCDGVRAFLGSRGLDLPEDAVVRLASSKNELVLELIRSGGVATFAGSRRFVAAVRSAGLGCAVVSASANCAEVLTTAGLDDLFDVRVDGVVAEREHLRGKPAPDTYLEAARRLHVPPAAAAVFEDARAGIAAGRSGHFGLVVGVDRRGRAAALREAGADVVVADLAELLR